MSMIFKKCGTGYDVLEERFFTDNKLIGVEMYGTGFICRI